MNWIRSPRLVLGTIQCLSPFPAYYVWLSLTLCIDLTDHFAFFTFIFPVWKGGFPKVGQPDGLVLSHLKCPALESFSLSFPQLTQDSKWMFRCLLGTRESILGSQVAFQLQINPKNPPKKGFVFQRGLMCWVGLQLQGQSPLLAVDVLREVRLTPPDPPTGSGLLQVLSYSFHSRELL